MSTTNTNISELRLDLQYLKGGAYSEDISIDLDNFSIEEEIKKFSMTDDLSVEPVGYSVLVRAYISPEKTKGGLILSQNTLDQQIYTNNTGLVVKKSNEAYDDPKFKKHDHWCQVGQWVAFDKTRANLHYIFGLPCWLVQEQGIELRLGDPRITTKR